MEQAAPADFTIAKAPRFGFGRTGGFPIGAPIMCPTPPPPIVQRLNRALDTIVVPVATWSKANGVVPHAASWGLAIVAIPLVAGIASRGWQAPAAMLVALVAYLRVYMPLKRALLPGTRRKLLIDLTLFVAPVYFVVCAPLGVPPADAADLLAFIVPAGIIILRSGCFFGGCCRGGPSTLGVRYPGGSGRFVPLPLFEALIGVLMLAAACGMTLASAGPGTLLAPLAVMYAAYRFGSEFFRARTGLFAVRRVFGLSVTQVLCLIIIAIATSIGGA